MILNKSNCIMFLLPYHNGMEDKRVPNASSAALAVGLGHDGKAAAQRQRHERDSSQHKLESVFYPLDGLGEIVKSFQNSCLENSMDRGAWWAAVHGVTKSQT